MPDLEQLQPGQVVGPEDLPLASAGVAPGDQEASRGPTSEETVHLVGSVVAYLRYRQRPDLMESYREQYKQLVKPFLDFLGWDEVSYLIAVPGGIPDWVRLALGVVALGAGAALVRLEPGGAGAAAAMVDAPARP